MTKIQKIFVPLKHLPNALSLADLVKGPIRWGIASPQGAYLEIPTDDAVLLKLAAANPVWVKIQP